MPIHYGPGWTKERVDLLTALWRDGVSCTQIAKQMGHITRNAVIGKAHRLGLDGREQPSRPGAPGASRAQRQIGPKAPSPPRQAPSSPRHIGPRDRPISTAGQAHSPGMLAGDIKPPTPIVERFTEGPGRATVLTLGAHMCKWPIGDPQAAGFTHCGARQEARGPYCAEHTARAYAPPSAKKTHAAELARSLRRYI